MPAPHRSSFSVTYADPDDARIVERAVRQEIGEIDDERSRTSLQRTGETVRITVEANDLVALRAASNTWLTLMDVAERSAEC